jgi:hypothetical protein
MVQFELGFWISLAVTASFIFLLFQLRSKNKEPAKLKLKNRSSSTLTPAPMPTNSYPDSRDKGESYLSQNRQAAEASSHKIPPYGEEFLSEASEPAREKSAEKSLNVFFIFNGHSWDAYEVLGVPPGSNLKTCELAYRKMISEVADDSRGFIDLAWKSILKNHGR